MSFAGPTNRQQPPEEAEAHWVIRDQTGLLGRDGVNLIGLATSLWHDIYGFFSKEKKNQRSVTANYRARDHMTQWRSAIWLEV